MSNEAIKTLTHAFISSRLDFCKVLYCGIAEGLERLESVQNAAAGLFRFTTVGTHNTCPAAAPLAAGTSTRDVQDSSWRRWSTARLQELHQPTCPTSITSLHLLECAFYDQLMSPGMCTSFAHNGYVVRCFAPAGPSLWNSLLLQIREPDMPFNRVEDVFVLCDEDGGAL